MKVIVFDTETVGKVSQDLLNVGYKVIDINIQHGDGITLVERDYVVRNLVDNKVYMFNDDFVGAEKLAMFEKGIADGKTIKRNLKQIYQTLVNDIEKNQVLFGYAYNCKFDLDKFKTQVPDGMVNPFEKIPVFDIWDYAVEYICNTEEYKTWATENKIFTESGSYISTSVESVCKYLYKNLNFKEDHTALSDVRHETYILLECIRRGADVTRPLKTNHFIANDIERTEVIVVDGNEQEIKFKKKYSRNGKTYYKS